MPCAGAALVAREWGVLGAGRGDRGRGDGPGVKGRGAVPAVGRCGGSVARDALLLEGISPVGWAFGLFCVRGGVSKGSLSPSGGRSGLFCKRSGVLKGIPSLCKCYNACEVWYRCESGPRLVGIAARTAHGARRPGLRRSRATQYRGENRHWLALRCASDYDDPHRVARLGREDALGQETTHWGRLITYPNAP